MHDGIQLERRGVVSGVVVTEPFGAARAMASLDGVPDFGFVTVGHPTAELAGQRLVDVARAAAIELEVILLEAERSK